MSEVHDGNHGEMSAQTLFDLDLRVRELERWLGDRAVEFHRFATDLSSTDSGFEGTAAFVIADRLKHYGDGLADLDRQMTTKNGVGVPDATTNANRALAKFGRDMAGAWYPNAGYLSDFPRLHVVWWQNRVAEYAQTVLRGAFGPHDPDWFRARLAEFPWPAENGGGPPGTR